MPSSTSRGRAEPGAPADDTARSAPTPADAPPVRRARRAQRIAGPPTGGAEGRRAGEASTQVTAPAAASDGDGAGQAGQQPVAGASRSRTRHRAARAGGGAGGVSRRTGEAPAGSSADAPAASSEPTTEEAGEATVEAPPLPLLDTLREPLQDVVEDERRLAEAARALGAGSGPLALDAERASGYRYGQRAYLVQLRREGAGTWLVDPIACPDLTPVAEATAGVEWILHAATQDLACLAEVGLRPDALFDTELAARLLGLPRAGLGAVVEHYLHVRLAKEHSAVDWSTRPLPEPWLRYAALDVELLADLREAMSADLAAQGKDEWARQEFEHLLGFTGPGVRVDPWRRTSGLHRVRGRRALAVVRELWLARDDLARTRDIAPGRIVPDAVLLQIAAAAPSTPAALSNAVAHRSVRRHQDLWLAAIARAQALPEADLPPAALPSDAPPPPRAWADRNPVAHARLTAVREELTRVAEQRSVPLENLLTPDVLRRFVWSLGDAREAGDVRADLAARGARPWQIDLVAPVVEAAVAAHR